MLSVSIWLWCFSLPFSSSESDVMNHYDNSSHAHHSREGQSNHSFSESAAVKRVWGEKRFIENLYQNVCGIYINMNSYNLCHTWTWLTKISDIEMFGLVADRVVYSTAVGVVILIFHLQQWAMILMMRMKDIVKSLWWWKVWAEQLKNERSLHLNFLRLNWSLSQCLEGKNTTLW